jgi:hypothetical protein
MNCQALRAACVRAETTAAGLAETGAWLATTADINATEIRLLHTGPAGTRIGIREVTPSDIRGRCAQAPSTFRVSAVAVLVAGGGIDPISSSSTAFAVGHVRPPGMS